MISILFSNFSRYTLLQDSRESWLYAQRVCCAFLLFLILMSIDKNSTGQGGSFFHTSSILFAIAMTFTAITSFASAITQDKENNSLGLILISDSSPSSYIRGRFLGRSIHIISLLTIILPIALFAITLGGVATKQILQVFFTICLWITLVSFVCFWASSLFATTKESTLVSIVAISCLFFIMLLFKFSPIHKINVIMSFNGYDGYFLPEIILVSVVCTLLRKSTISNFAFAAVFPITFWDEYASKIRSKKQKAETYQHSTSSIRKRVGYNAITDKDRSLIHRNINFIEYARLHPLLACLICILGLMFFPFLLVALFLYLPWTFFKLWIDMTKFIDLEFKEGTLTSLALLPLSRKEFFKEKFKYFENTIMILWLIYGIATLFIVIIYITQLGNTMFILMSIGASLTFLALPALMIFIKYLNMIIIFQSRRVDKLNLFFASLTVIMLYFFIPVIVPLTVLFLIPIVKKMCFDKFDECIAII